MCLFLDHYRVLAAATRVPVTRGAPGPGPGALGRADPAVWLGRREELRLPGVPGLQRLPQPGAPPAQAPGQGRRVDHHAARVMSHVTRVTRPLVTTVSIGTSHSQT